MILWLLCKSWLVAPVAGFVMEMMLVSHFKPLEIVDPKTFLLKSTLSSIVFGMFSSRLLHPHQSTAEMLWVGIGISLCSSLLNNSVASPPTCYSARPQFPRGGCYLSSLWYLLLHPFLVCSFNWSSFVFIFFSKADIFCICHIFWVCTWASWFFPSSSAPSHRGECDGLVPPVFHCPVVMWNS